MEAPTTTGGAVTAGATAGGGRFDVEDPTISCVTPAEACKATVVATAPVPKTIGEPGARVWPETMNWDAEFGAMVLPATTIGAGSGAGLVA